MASIVDLIRRWRDRMLSVLRIMVGLLFLEHGTAKWLSFPYSATYAHLNPLSLTGVAGFLELIGGILLTLGLFTRATAFILSGEMAAAYFLSHAPRGFFPVLNGGDAAILYCVTFFYLVFAGGGPWSLDARRPAAAD